MKLRLYPAVLFFMFFSILTVNPLSGENFLFRTGFEEETSIKDLVDRGWSGIISYSAKYWPQGAKAEPVNDTAFTGNRSLMLHSESPEKVINVSTPGLAVKGGSQVKISAAMKLERVVTGEKGWYKARIGYGTFGKDSKPIQGGFKSFVERDGTTDWSRYEITTVLPPEAERLIVYLELKNCTGTAWFDEVKIEILRDGSVLSSILSSGQELSASAPVIIPKPWQEKYGGGVVPLEEPVMIADPGEETAKTELIEFIKSLTGSAPAEQPQASGKTLIVMGSPSGDAVKKHLLSAGVSADWKELGDQGYVVYAGTVRGKNVIILAGTSPESRFYALQTLKQMAVKQGGKDCIYAGLIEDRPLYKRRGAVFGGMRRWYEGPLHIKDGRAEYSGWPYRERFHALKFNFIWLAGWGNNHYARQVLPLADSDKKVLGDFLQDCRKYFITPSVGLRPYRQLPHPGRDKGGVIYSSEEDIEGVVNNLAAMYDMGYRDLYVTFDDMPPYRFLEYEEDKARFESIGKAHLYYIGEVYKRLKKRCPDVNFRILGVEYGGRQQMTAEAKKYLEEISALPEEIEIIFTSPGSGDIDYSSKLSGGRGVMIWSNYYPSLYEKLAQVPAIVNPYGGGDSTLHQHTTGHFTLFVDDDAAHISWYTAADYMWNPSTYNPELSARRALIKSAGYEFFNLLQGYKELTHKIGGEGIKGSDGRERIADINRITKELDDYMDKLNSLNSELYQQLSDQSAGYKEFLAFLRGEYEKRPCPVTAAKCAAPPVIDGNTDDECWSKTSPVTGFLNLRENSPAVLQTAVHLTYDASNLYLLAIMNEPETANLKEVFKDRDSSVFIDDSLEFFIGSFDSLRNYYHIAVNPLGTVYDEKAQDAGWNGKYKIMTSKKENSWIIEMAVPWENFNFPKTNLLRFNFTRNRCAGGKREYTTYAPLYGSGFHLPQWFWLLRLK